MPKKNFKNIGTLQGYEYVAGVIDSIGGGNDTCGLTVGDVTFEDVPIFYHCHPEAEERENGALEGAAGAFAVGDDVIVLRQRKPDKIGNSALDDALSLFVIGHIEEKRHCKLEGIILFFEEHLTTGWVSRFKAVIVSYDGSVRDYPLYMPPPFDPASPPEEMPPPALLEQPFEAYHDPLKASDANYYTLNDILIENGFEISPGFPNDAEHLFGVRTRDVDYERDAFDGLCRITNNEWGPIYNHDYSEEIIPVERTADCIDQDWVAKHTRYNKVITQGSLETTGNAGTFTYRGTDKNNPASPLLNLPGGGGSGRWSKDTHLHLASAWTAGFIISSGCTNGPELEPITCADAVGGGGLHYTIKEGRFGGGIITAFDKPLFAYPVPNMRENSNRLVSYIKRTSDVSESTERFYACLGLGSMIAYLTNHTMPLTYINITRDEQYSFFIHAIDGSGSHGSITVSWQWDSEGEDPADQFFEHTFRHDNSALHYREYRKDVLVIDHLQVAPCTGATQDDRHGATVGETLSAGEKRRRAYGSAAAYSKDCIFEYRKSGTVERLPGTVQNDPEWGLFANEGCLLNLEVYHCGEPPDGDRWHQVDVAALEKVITLQDVLNWFETNLGTIKTAATTGRIHFPLSVRGVYYHDFLVTLEP